MYQIWRRSEKNCGRYHGRNVCANTHTETDIHTHRQTDTHTQIYTQVILHLSNAMNCIKQTNSNVMQCWVNVCFRSVIKRTTVWNNANSKHVIQGQMNVESRASYKNPNIPALGMSSCGYAISVISLLSASVLISTAFASTYMCNAHDAQFSRFVAKISAWVNNHMQTVIAVHRYNTWISDWHVAM